MALRIVGELDYKREKQLEEIENRLKDLQKLKTWVRRRNAAKK